jgi:hypothetical protein
MAKFAYAVLGTVAVVVAVAGAAFGASGAAKCGHLYQPKCKKPAIGGKTVTVKCHKVGTTFTVPTLTFRAVAGLKSITITVHSKPRTLLALTNLHGATVKTIRNLRLNTKGLRSGPHAIVVQVTDLRNVTTSEVIPFALCVPPKPITTG